MKRQFAILAVTLAFVLVFVKAVTGQTAAWVIKDNVAKVSVTAPLYDACSGTEPLTDLQKIIGIAMIDGQQYGPTVEYPTNTPGERVHLTIPVKESNNVYFIVDAFDADGHQSCSPTISEVGAVVIPPRGCSNLRIENAEAP